MQRKQLGQMLIEAGAIDEGQLRTALGDQRRWGRPLGRTLVELRLIREEDLVRVLAQQLGLPTVDLDRLTIPRAIIELVPSELARQHNLVPFAQPMKFLDVAMLDPMNLGVIDELRIRTQLNVRPYLAGPKMIERALMTYYAHGPGTSVDDFDVPMLEPARRVTAQERESVSIGLAAAADVAPAVAARGAELRDGLRPFPAAPAAAAAPPLAPRRPAPLTQPPPPVSLPSRDQEIDALQQRISKLEALVARDEAVLRKLLALLIDKGLATREEIIERLG